MMRVVLMMVDVRRRYVCTRVVMRLLLMMRWKLVRIRYYSTVLLGWQMSMSNVMIRGSGS